jgi:hypothetical protein
MHKATPLDHPNFNIATTSHHTEASSSRSWSNNKNYVEKDARKNLLIKLIPYN